MDEMSAQECGRVLGLGANMELKLRIYAACRVYAMSKGQMSGQTMTGRRCGYRAGVGGVATAWREQSM